MGKETSYSHSAACQEMKWTSKLKKQKKTIVSIYIRVKYNAIQTIIVQLPAAVAEVEWYFAYNACK